MRKALALLSKYDDLAQRIPARKRKALYRLVSSGLVVLGLYGVLTDDQSSVVLLIAASVLDVARANVQED